MSWNRRGVSACCWLLAGVPIVASFVQATVALLRTSASGIPVIGGLKAFLLSIPVFRTAAVVFTSSSAIVLLLFVLLTVAWVAQGLGLFILRHRVLTLASTGFLTLFLVLFELVYLPVFSADVPLVQAGGFLLVPVLAVGTSWAATLGFDWDLTLEEEAADDLTVAQREVNVARETFEEQFVRDRARNSLRSFAPELVGDIEADAESFRDRCDSLGDRVESLTAASMESRERKEKAAQLRSEAETLDPAGVADRLRSELKKGLIERIRKTFGDLHQVSRYGQAYEVRNVHTHNELSLPSLEGPPVQIGGDNHELADRLIEGARAEQFEAVASGIERSQEHRSDLAARLDEEESAVVTALDTTSESLVRAQDHLDRLQGKAKERLEELLQGGRGPLEVPGEPTVSDHETAAKAALHEGRFEDAREEARAAKETAEAIELLAEFYGESVAATIEYGGGSIPIPDSVDRELVSNLRVPFERTYGIEYTVDGDSLKIVGDEEDGTTSQPSHREQQSNRQSRTDGPNPDDVLYVLNELQLRATATDGADVVELQTETLREKFAAESVLAELQSFAERQTEVVGVSVPESPPPGFLTIEVADGVSPARVLDDLQDQYAKNR